MTNTQSFIPRFLLCGVHSSGNKWPTMNISFPDLPPVDPLDGDYLTFGALVDGKPIKCCVTFSVLIPRSNNPETAKLAFWKKKDHIYATARAMIEAGEIRDDEILVDSLTSAPPPAHVEFPDVAPTVDHELNALAFPAIAGEESITCIVPIEVLIGPVRLGSPDIDEAIRVYQTQKADLHEKVREMIAAGKVDADGELWITGLGLGPA